MELKQFITESLVQIIEGIDDAKKRLNGSSAEVSPTYTNRQVDLHEKMEIIRSMKGNVIHNVDFDVAVTAIDGSGTKGSIGVVAGIFGLSSSGESNQSHSTISRIKFSVPITLPKDQVSES